jgi:hypothetical protein
MLITAFIFIWVIRFYKETIILQEDESDQFHDEINQSKTQ